MRTLPVVALLVAFGTAGPAALAQDTGDHSSHATHAEPAPAQAPAVRFATDAVLREEMERIRTAVTGLGHYEQGHLDAAQAAPLVAQVEASARTIFANCKLPPDADAALHAILVPLLQGAAALKADPADVAAIAPMREALAAYDRTFDPQATPPAG
jgi:hypothetical protein